MSSGEEPESEHDRTDAPPPPIPKFFEPADLPEWLRTPLAPPPPAVRHASARTRQAWATPDTLTTPEETDEFQTAGATALTQLVPTAPARATRKRRGLFGIGGNVPLAVFAA